MNEPKIKLTAGEIRWLSQDPQVLESLITYHDINKEMAFNMGGIPYFENARIEELKQLIKEIEDDL